jgi:ATP-dependent Clp protease ATP-binding subunit ClpA
MLQTRRLEQRLADRRIILSISESVLDLIVDKGYDPIYGARPLKRAIQKYLENPLSMAILKGEIPDGSRIVARVENDSLVFDKQENKIIDPEAVKW